MNSKHNLLKQLVRGYLLEDDTSFSTLITNDDIQFLSYHRLDTIAVDLFPQQNFIDEYQYKVILSKKNEKHIYNLETCVVANYINHLLKEANVPFVFLKGIGLSINNYKHISHRYYYDIDMLVDVSDISRVESLLLDKAGYTYGKFRKNAYGNSVAVYANREEVLFQKTYTHELYKMIKTYDNGLQSSVDVNFKFSWLGNKSENAINIHFDDFRKNIYMNDIYLLPSLQNEYNFIHLVCHFFNEAVYFTYNDIDFCEDPNEIVLIRLFDIFLVLKACDVNELIRIISKHNSFKQVIFVLSFIYYALDIGMGLNENLDRLYNNCGIVNLEDINYYYSTDGAMKFWPISIEERLFDLELKMMNCKNLFINSL